MTKDSENLLKFVVDKAGQENSEEVFFSVNEVVGIPNLAICIRKLCQELEQSSMICRYKVYVNNTVTVSLTSDGLEYFMEKREAKEMMENQKISFTVNGGQVNLASGNATINASQNNGVKANELDNIISGIMSNIASLNKEDADKIADVVEMAKDELSKPEPKVSRLRNCLALIAPMFTIANGIPTLATNIQRLQEVILQYIK